MKKNVKSEKVLRAITIGISAMLAVNSMPLTVLADETEPEGDDNHTSSTEQETKDENKDTSVDAAAAQEEATQKAVNTAQDACDTVVKEVTNSSSDTETSDSAASDSTNSDTTASDSASSEASYDQNIAEAAKALDQVINGSVANNVENDVTGAAETDNTASAKEPAAAPAVAEQETPAAVINPETAVENIQKDVVKSSTIDDNLSDAKESLDDADTASKTADVTAKEAISAVNDAQKTADEFDQAMNGSESTDENGAPVNTPGIAQKVEELAGQISEAKSVEEAKTAYKDLNALADEAGKKASEATDKLNELEAKYNEAMKKLDGAKKMYSEAVKGAHTDATYAQTKLATAQKKVDALQAAIKDAQDNVAKENAAALAIIDMQEALAKAVDKENRIIWQGKTSSDSLFTTIMENYYVPQILGNNSSDVTDIKVKRIQGIDNDTYNYFEVTYKSKGETKTAYYNYLMDGTSKTDIVIFEKTAEEVGAANAIKSYYGNLSGDAKKNFNKKQKVYKYEDEKGDTQYLCEDEVNSRIAQAKENNVESDFIILTNGSIYLKGSAGKVTPLITLSTKDTGIKANSDERTTEDTIVDNTRESYFEIRDGVLTKVETADVTTTTYKKTGVESEKKYDNEEEARKALDALKSGKEVTSEDIKYISSWITSGKYYETFTNRLTGKKNVTWGEGLWGLITGTDAVNNEWKELVSDIKSKCTDQGNYTDITIGDVTAKKDKNILGYKKYKFDGTFSYDGKEHFSVGSDGTEAASEEASRELWMKKADEAAKSDSLKGFSQTSVKSWFGLEKGTLYDATATVNYEDVKTTELKKFYYILEYMEQVGNPTTAEKQEIQAIQYNVAKQLVKTLEQNSKFANGEISLDENEDEAFNSFINKAKNLVNKYDKYAADAEKAKNAVDDAKVEADKLVGAIENLGDYDKETDEFNFSAAKVLGVKDVAAFLGIDIPEKEKEAFNKKTIDEVKKYLDDLLNKAKEKVTAALEKQQEVEKKREQAGKDLDETIKKLTPPSVNPGTSSPKGNEDGTVTQPTGTTTGTASTTASTTGAATDTTTGTTTTTGTATAVLGGSEVVAPTGIFTMPFGLDALPAAGVAGARVARAAGTVADVAEPEAGVAGVRRELANNEDTEDKTKVDSVILGDEEVPLAAVPEEEKANMNWWWLVVVALLGATGYELYKKHEAKKKAEATVDNTENE